MGSRGARREREEHRERDRHEAYRGAMNTPEDDRSDEQIQHLAQRAAAHRDRLCHLCGEPVAAVEDGTWFECDYVTPAQGELRLKCFQHVACVERQQAAST